MSTKQTGRPTKYKKMLATTICQRLAEGESLRSICRDEDMPAMSTVMRWLLDERYKRFWEQYAQAREIQAEALFEETLEIADDGTNDYTTRLNKNDEEYAVANVDHIARSRLRVDTRKWYLSKVLPKKYGEKLDVTSDGEKVTSVSVTVHHAPQS